MVLTRRWAFHSSQRGQTTRQETTGLVAGDWDKLQVRPFTKNSRVSAPGKGVVAVTASVTASLGP